MESCSPFAATWRASEHLRALSSAATPVAEGEPPRSERESAARKEGVEDGRERLGQGDEEKPAEGIANLWGLEHLRPLSAAAPRPRADRPES